MSTSPKSEVSVAQSDSDLIAGLKLQFDQNWDAGQIDTFAANLASWPPESRGRALIELVKIDLERRWQSGHSTEVEQYLARFPDLGTTETVAPELLLTEWEARQQFGEPPRFGDFARRFPKQAPELQQLIRQADAHESALRQVAKRDTSKVTSAKVSSTPVGERGGASPPVKSQSRTHLEADATPLDDLPEVFGRYRILKELGGGGMGTVYLALDTQLDREVALKVPHFNAKTDSEFLERFDREAKTAAKLSHANICQVYDVGEIDGRRYLTMEFIDGRPLSKLVGSKSLKDLVAIQLVRQVALAVGAAHKQGIIHRDLKPANIMLTSDGRPKVTDFGLARRLGVSDQRLTQSGMIIGTPAYMPLEQLQGELDQVGPHSDVYSLGVILYELLTGHLPFDVPSDAPVMSLFAKILTSPPDSPTKYRPELDPRLETIVLKAIAKQHTDRYQTMAQFAEALSEYRRAWGVSPAVVPSNAPTPNIADPTSPAALQPTGGLTPPARLAETQSVPAAFPVFTDEPGDSTNPALQKNRGKKSPSLKTTVLFSAKALQSRWIKLPFPAQAATIIAGFGALLLLGVILFFRNGNAQVKVTIDADDVEVTFNNEAIKLKDGTHNYEINPGPHTLHIKSGNAAFDTDTFMLKKGDNPAVTVELVKDEIVAKWGEKALAVNKIGDRNRPVIPTGRDRPDDGAKLPVPLFRELATLTGHTAKVSNVAFSADGKRLASSSDDKTVKVWDTTSGAVLLTTKGDSDGLKSVAFSADGKRLAAASLDKTVKVLDAISGEVLLTLKGHTNIVTSVAFSADGNRVASASYDQTVKVWDATSGQELLTLHGHTNGVQCVKFSADGKRLVSASGHFGTRSKSGEVKVWDTASGQEVLTLKGHTGGIFCVAISTDGKQLASAGYDRAVKVWDIASGQSILTLKGHTELIFSVAFSPDGKQLASASDDRTIKVWDVTSGKVLLTLFGHTGYISNVTFSADGKWLASASDDKTVKLWGAAEDQRSAKKKEPVAAPANGPIDLLKQIDLKRDAVAGEWKFLGGDLQQIATVNNSRLQIPLIVPEEYRLDIRAERTGELNFGLNVGFVIGGRQAMLDIDGYGKPPDTLNKVGTAIGWIDGKRGDGTETVYSLGKRLLPMSQTQDFAIEVRRQTIVVQHNGKEIIRWSGDPSRLSLSQEYWAVPNRKALILGAQAPFRISKYTLTPISFTTEATPNPAKSLKLLFLGDNEHHQPRARFGQLQPVMKSRGIELEYSNVVSDLNVEKLAKFDGLVLFANINTITPAEAKALLDFVASGKGFIPLHCASHCFRNNDDVTALIGAQFDRHGTGVFRVTTTEAGKSHPLMAGYSGFESFDETYVHKNHNEKDRIVLETRAEGAAKEPWTWVRTHGQGRVFYTAWGHDERTWGNAGFQDLVERGIRWACGAAEAKQPGSMTSTAAISPGQWTPLVTAATKLPDAEIWSFTDGVLRGGNGKKLDHFTSAELPIAGITAKDVIVRSRVTIKEAVSSDVIVRLRGSEKGYYNFFYNNWFGIQKNVGAQRRGLKEVSDGPSYFPREVDFAVAAVGNRLTMFLEGKGVVEVTDNDHAEGTIALGVKHNGGTFKNPEVMVLDGVAGVTSEWVEQTIQKRMSEMSGATVKGTAGGSSVPITPPSVKSPFSSDKAKQHQQAWADYLGVPVTFENSIGMKFSLIPPGEFDMGGGSESEDDILTNGNRRHHVTLTKPYYLGRYETRQRDFQTVTNKNPAKFSPSNGGSLDHPVETLAYADIEDFCKKLSAIAGEKNSGRAYRLPTEAEWEFACRAGTTTRFSCGETITRTQANFTGPDKGIPAPLGKTTRVGEYAPNAWGLFDMHGNACEWTSDSNVAFTPEAVVDPRINTNSNTKVFKGGDFGSTESVFLSSGMRYYGGLGASAAHMGFRVLLEIPDDTAVRQSQLKPTDAVVAVPKTTPVTPEVQIPLKAGSVLVNSVGMKLALIPAGRFMMGSPTTEVGRGNDETQHQVTFKKPFLIGVYEVTQDEYFRVMGKNPSRFARLQQIPINREKPELCYPVECISVDDAAAFCKALNERPEEKQAVRTYRAPTEAEWEYACRAGSTGPWSDSSIKKNRANVKRPFFGETHPVGAGRPNAWGLYGMDSNVWEWCADLYGPYPSTPQTDPLQLKGDLRVIRGGWHGDGENLVGSAQRHSMPSIRIDDVGFRVVCEPSTADLSKLRLSGKSAKGTKKANTQSSN